MSESDVYRCQIPAYTMFKDGLHAEKVRLKNGVFD